MSDALEKPLALLSDLFRGGIPSTSMDTKSPRHLQLLLAFEQAIVHFDHERPGLTDGTTQLVLEKLAVKPEAAPKGDALLEAIQGNLRRLLADQEYHRDEVRGAARTLLKSVQRHSRRGGQRGYLDFLHENVPHGH